MVHVPAGSLDVDTASLMLRALMSSMEAKNLPEAASKNTFGSEIESAQHNRDFEIVMPTCCGYGLFSDQSYVIASYFVAPFTGESGAA